MNSIQLYFSSRMLSKKLAPLLTKQLIDDKDIQPSKANNEIINGRMKVTLVNLNAVCYQKLSEFVEDMDKAVADAVKEGSQVICFPQYTGMLPLTIFSLYDQLEEDAENALLKGDAHTLSHIGEIYCKYLSSTVFDCYYNTFALLAMKYRVYIQAGTILVKTSRGLVNRGFLFNPEGESILQQDKLYPNQGEKWLGVHPGTELKTAETPFGSLAIIIGEDSRYFETYKLAQTRGCKIVFAPGGGEHYPSVKYYRSAALMRAQESTMFVVQPILFYNLFPTKGKGVGAFYCPYQISDSGDGIISYLKEAGSLTTRLNTHHLTRLVDDYTGDKNSIVYRLLAEEYEKHFGMVTTVPPKKEADAAFLAEEEDQPPIDIVKKALETDLYLHD